MIKKIIPILLLACTYFIGQLYSYWDYASTETVNWIWSKECPMNIAWNVKYLSEEVNRIIEATAFFLMIRKSEKMYKLVALEYLLYRCLDIMYYFYNFKTERYWFVFLILGTIMALIYLKNHATTREKTNNIR